MGLSFSSPLHFYFLVLFLDVPSFRSDRVANDTSASSFINEVSFSVGTDRLKSYAEKCLQMKTILIRDGIIHSETETNRFTPKFEQSENNATLILQFKAKGTLGKTPPDGFYVAVIDLKAKDSGVQVDSFYYDQLGMRFKNVSVRALEWLKNEKHLCPELKAGV